MTKRKKIQALGQHFLKSQSVLKKILHQISPNKKDLVIEIGPGKGALTFPLVEKAGKVIAIEKDPSFIPFLRKKNISNLTVLKEDILKVDFNKLKKEEKKYENNLKLVGNLPYSISSPLLFKVLQERELFSKCVFLLQKEVAERLCSKPGSKSYAPLSILFQIHFFTRLHFIVPPECFYPPPRVDSALISLIRRKRPLFPIEKEELFKKFLKGAFKHRRKILLKNLEKLNFSRSLIDKAYLKFGMERNLRAEQLPISQFVALFTFFY